MGKKLLIAAGVLAAACATAGPVGFGVTNTGDLFRFDPAATASSTTIGNLGFVPEGIDFRPGSGILYAVNVDSTTGAVQLYTVNTTTGAAAAVGAGFTNAGLVNVASPLSIGFDFNPTTLQGDNSMRIRLVASNGTNLRLNSSTGLLAATDPNLNGTPTPGIDNVAYTNTASATVGGPTTLYALDFTNDVLGTINTATGAFTPIGPFGVTIDALLGISFDIYTNPIGGANSGYAVLRRTAVSGGAYLLYNVDLTTGATTGGALVDGGRDFTGGLAITDDSNVPEPSSIILVGLGAAFFAWRRLKRS